ncbi:MAG: hypothetical protein HUJ26_22880 [Planctomycetaceae bacterium]|nr:hypothetical protein [Planctomycetaceae bacterium]
MLDSREEILNAALQLSEADRLVIANRLLDTLSADVPGLALDDPALAAELDRRSGDWENSIPWSELSRQLKKTK